MALIGGAVIAEIVITYIVPLNPHHPLEEKFLSLAHRGPWV